MKQSDIDQIYSLLELITVTDENKDDIIQIKQALEDKNYELVLEKLDKIMGNKKEENTEINDETEDVLLDEEKKKNHIEKIEEKSIYPRELTNKKLEEQYIGLLLTDPKSISMYYFLYEDCFFADPKLVNIYKSVLFTSGEAYAPEIAKNRFNFAKESEESNNLKYKLKKSIVGKIYSFEKVYTELKKLFVLRKSYLGMPIKEIQDKIVEIVNYELYDKMSVEEVESAVEQVTVTGKFKKSILNQDVTKFLITGDNNLTNGLEIQFKILSSVFKGIRKGETMSFAMPSNSGKSRFTINLASNIAFIHKKKVLIISNEMSEEKMKLCLITTILNNPDIQKLHGQVLKKTEGEILEFKFRPDDIKNVKTDENGFIIREKNETKEAFIKRLTKVSSEYNKTIQATDWLNKQINNSIYFINITDHTNDELKKVITNYYYKEKIEYMFYDTLKTDTANIGNGEELKKTATILSNLAQNFNIFIGSTLQLTETNTLPINLNINDLAVSRTVKEVLDTLCLIKQINSATYDDYEYSLKEVDTKFYDIEKYENPDIRYYACVVDKNRAGAKPTVVFRLNLAYNIWEELGYLRLKQK